MKKMLFIGFGSETKFAIEYAKGLGVYTILSDYIPYEKNPFKHMVDEAWDIDAADIDSLEQKVKESGVTAVFAGSNEFCLDTVHELTKRLGLPFYASDTVYKAARDKGYFKSIAEKVGLRVPKSYQLTEEFLPEDLQKIQYPVIVKPTDQTAARGIAVCSNEDELKRAYRNAIELSLSGNALVEQFISGIGSGIFYVLHNGKATLHFGFGADAATSLLPENLFDSEGYRPLSGFPLYRNVNQTEEDREAISRLFQELHATEGVTSLQYQKGADGKNYYFELGYRLDGDLIWKVAEQGGDANQIKILMNYALGLDTPEEEYNKSLDDTHPIYGAPIWMKSGTVKSISGVEKANSIPGVNIFISRFVPGSVVKDGPRTLENIGFIAAIKANDDDEFLDKIAHVKSCLHVISTTNENMIL